MATADQSEQSDTRNGRSARAIGVRIQGPLLVLAMLSVMAFPSWPVIAQAAAATAGDNSGGAAAPQASQAQQAPQEIQIISTRTTLGLTESSTSGSRLDIPPLEVPASVQIIQGDTLRDRGDVTIMQAETQAAGIINAASPGNGNLGLTYRGFSGVNAVMQLFDGTQLAVGSGTVTFPFDTWMVDHIEVLGGPASVLYGVGAIGGTVNVVSRKPDTNEEQNLVQLSAGSFGTYQEALDSTGPLSPVTAYRLDISHQSSNGWIDRGGSHSLAISASIQAEVTPDLRLTLSEDYGFQSPMEYWGTPLIAGALDTALTGRNFTVEDSFMKFQDSVTQFKADWSPNAAMSVHNDLYVLTTHREWHDLESYAYQPATADVLRSGYFLIHHNELQVGDEAHLTWAGRLLGLKNEVEAGFDINGIHFTNANNSPYAGSSPVDPFDFAPGRFVSQGPFRATTLTDTREYAVFAEDRLQLLDNLSVVAGGRYDDTQLAASDPSLGTSQYDGSGQSFDKRFSSPTYRVGIVYNPVKNLSLYAQYATATAALGSLITTTISQAAFKLATGRQVELGVKQAFWEDRGEWTLAAYQIVQDNLLTPDPLNPTISDQVGQQSSKGLEASAALSLTQRWRIEANGTVLKARYEDFLQTVGTVAVSRAGKLPPNVPQSAANLFVTWQVARVWQLRAGTQYVGHRFADSADTLTLPAYNVVSAGARFTPLTSLALDLRVDNAFDRLYPLVAGNGGTQWILGPPRSVTFTLDYRF